MNGFCKNWKWLVFLPFKTQSTLDVLWGQPIMLTQVASTSELLENQWNDLVFLKIIPSHFCRASEASKIERFKNEVRKVWTKIFNSTLKK
jgi:hypothetical protein